MKLQRISVFEMMICALFTALIAVGAFIKIPVPYVPFTLQFLFTNLAGLLLGKRLGAISASLYIAIGLIGLPVFANGGGIGYIAQPTFGYLIGFILGTWVGGYIIEKTKALGLKAYILAGFANLSIVYILGMIYYYIVSNYYINSPIGISALILYCFLLSVPGDIVICIVSAGIAIRLRPVINNGVKHI